MDNFWDLKGLLAVFERVLIVVGCSKEFVKEKTDIIKGLFDKQQLRS
jgi:hypothetical protein